MPEDILMFFSIAKIVITFLAKIVIPLLKIIFSSQREKKRDSEKLDEKKTEVLIAISKLHDNASELLLILAKKINLFQENSHLKNERIKEHVRLRGNLFQLTQEKEFLSEAHRKLQETNPTDIESWERMTATYRSWSNNIQSNIKKEQVALNELKEALAFDG